MSIFLLLFVLNNQETLDLFIVAESNIFLCYLAVWWHSSVSPGHESLNDDTVCWEVRGCLHDCTQKRRFVLLTVY